MVESIKKISKNDFIEIEFTGTIIDTGEIFDTNIEEDAKKSNLNIPKERIRPFVLSVGNKMLPKGFDLDLEGKELTKKYDLELDPENAFGKRNPQMVKMIPTKQFHEQKINPERGMQLSLDGQLVRILSSSGGRTLVDFNNPLAGKKVKYSYKILKKIDDESEKINSLQDFLFRKQFPFKVDKTKKEITFALQKVEEPLAKFIEIMSKPFEDTLGLKAKAEIAKEEAPKEKETKKEEKSNKDNKKESKD